MTSVTLLFFGFSVVLSLLQVVRALSPFPVFTYTDEKTPIVLLDTAVDNDPFSWYLVKDDGGTKAPWCHDYDVTKLKAKPGYHIQKIRYEDRGTCWGILRADLGIWWRRDPVTHLVIKEDVVLQPDGSVSAPSIFR